MPYGGPRMSRLNKHVASPAFLIMKQKALGKPMWPGYYELIEPNSTKYVKALYEKGKNGRRPMDMYPWLRQVC